MSLISSERIFTGRVVALDQDRVAFPNGSIGTLEMIRHPGAAAVVPFVDQPESPDPVVVLIRQFRHAANGWLWEIPAGTREVGETPFDCAHRELIEESGYRAKRIEQLTSVFTTPGFTDEVIHLFIATQLSPAHAAPQADEFLEVHQLPWSRVMAMVSAGEIRDAKTLVALLYVQGFLRKT